MMTKKDTVRLAKALDKISRERTLTPDRARELLAYSGMYDKDGTRLYVAKIKG